MLFLVFFIPAFTAVISEHLLGVSYNFDESYFDTFSDRQCVNSTQWDLVSYGYLDVVPPYEETSLSIRSSRNSCTTSFPIVFLNGTLELTVYLRTISKYSGITVSVFDQNNEAMVSVKYRRSNSNFVPGWAVLLVPTQKHTTGYVQISGQSLHSELVIVDSLRYVPDNSTDTKSDEKTQTITNSRAQNTHTTDQTKSVFNENGIGVSEISEDDIDGSGEGETDEASATEDPDENTEDPDTETDTEAPSPEEETNNPDPEDNGFWNAFTITFVSVGAFSVVGLVGVGSYYIGKNRGVSQNPPVDLESIEPPSPIIPRARSIFSDAAPYDRFSRNS